MYRKPLQEFGLGIFIGFSITYLFTSGILQVNPPQQTPSSITKGK